VVFGKESSRALRALLRGAFGFRAISASVTSGCEREDERSASAKANLF
jgi:hypothetical protein